MTLPVQKDDTLHYHVPIFQYYTDITINMDREGYEELKLHAQRNIGRALLFMDSPSVNRFRDDWMNAIDMFEGLQVIDGKYAETQRKAAREYNKVALKKGAQFAIQQAQQITSHRWFWKAVGTVALGLGAYAVVKSQQVRQ